jgi:hypothetical protein
MLLHGYVLNFYNAGVFTRDRRFGQSYDRELQRLE